MDKVKRRPGRPKGSETDDSAPLMAMGRLLTDDPKLAPKTAARRVFRASGQAVHLEDASIHRWQGKWKTAGSSYLQRVRDERAAAEAEQRRREQVAADARERGRKSWPEIMAELQAAGQLPGWNNGNTAWDAFAKHREGMREMSSQWDGLSAYRSAAEVAAGRFPDLGTLTGYRAPAALAAGHLTAFDMFAQARQPGSALYEAMQAHRSVLDNPELADTMRKYGDIGRALKDAGAFGQGVKLPKGF